MCDSLTNEVWKDILGWEGIYQIGNRGRIRSFKMCEDGRIISLKDKTGNYLTIILQKSGMKSRSTRIHRLVAEAFIPNPYNLPEVNHIDGNKQNNAVSNLEWCTRKHNAAHARTIHPNMLNGMIAYNKYERPRTVLQFSKGGEFLQSYCSAKEAERKTGICSRNILQVANKTPFNEKGQVRKTAGGYIWRFEKEVISCDI